MIHIHTARVGIGMSITCGVLVADNRSRTACVSLSSSPCSEASADDPSPSDQAPDEAPPPLPPLSGPRVPFNSLRGDSDGVLAPELKSENVVNN